MKIMKNSSSQKYCGAKNAPANVPNVQKAPWLAPRHVAVLSAKTSIRRWRDALGKGNGIH